MEARLGLDDEELETTEPLFFSLLGVRSTKDQFMRGGILVGGLWRVETSTELDVKVTGPGDSGRDTGCSTRAASAVREDRERTGFLDGASGCDTRGIAGLRGAGAVPVIGGVTEVAERDEEEGTGNGGVGDWMII